MPFLEFVNGAIRTSQKAYEEFTQQQRSRFPVAAQVADTMSSVVDKVTDYYSQTALGVAEEEAVKIGTEVAGPVGGFLLGAVLPGPDFSRGAASYQRLIKRSQEIEKLSTKIQEYRSIGKTSRMAKNEAKLSSAQSNVLPFTPENPKAYPANTAAAKEIVAAEKLKRGTTDILHLHHKLPKGMSAAFFDRMDQFISRGEAVSDDLLEMAEEATKVGVSTGDIKSNILAIADKPHSTLHTEMRAMGSGTFGRMELGKKELMAAMREAKDPTSLKALWKAWINDDAKYLVETAEVWEPLDALIKEVRSTK
jgi:hypothetical protein